MDSLWRLRQAEAEQVQSSNLHKFHNQKHFIKRWTFKDLWTWRKSKIRFHLSKVSSYIRMSVTASRYFVYAQKSKHIKASRKILFARLNPLQLLLARLLIRLKWKEPFKCQSMCQKHSLVCIRELNLITNQSINSRQPLAKLAIAHINSIISIRGKVSWTQTLTYQSSFTIIRLNGKELDQREMSWTCFRQFTFSINSDAIHSRSTLLNFPCIVIFLFFLFSQFFFGERTFSSRTLSSESHEEIVMTREQH